MQAVKFKLLGFVHKLDKSKAKSPWTQPYIVFGSHPIQPSLVADTENKFKWRCPHAGWLHNAPAVDGMVGFINLCG